MRKRDLPEVRRAQRGTRELLMAMFDPAVKSYARDRVLGRMGITLDEARATYSGEQSASEVDQRVRIRRRRSADARAIAARTESVASRNSRLSFARRSSSPEVTALIEEQERDARWGSYIPNRPWLISLDHPWNNDDSHEPRDTVAYYARRRGDFSTEAPWVPPLIDRIDRERERMGYA